MNLESMNSLPTEVLVAFAGVALTGILFAVLRRRG